MPSSSPPIVTSRLASTASPTRSGISWPRHEKSRPAGRAVRYLNIGDPIPFGFSTPPAPSRRSRERARDGHNGYVPSPGITRGARSGGRRLDATGFPADARSRARHCRHLGGDRAGADCDRRSRATRCSCQCRRIRSTPPCSRRSARTRAITGPTRRTAGSPISTTSNRSSPRARGPWWSSTPTIRPVRCIPTPRGVRSSTWPSGTVSCCWPTRSTGTSRTKVPSGRWAASRLMPRSSPSRASRRRISLRGGAPVGWWSAGIRG